MRKISLLIPAALLTLFAGHASADVIGLKTNRTAGETITLALNSGLSATMAWSNGTTETCTFSGLPVEITVVSDSLTITSSEGIITHFYAPDAGMVSLNTAGAPQLQKLMCADNALQKLDLKANKALTELDCRGNQLTELSLAQNAELTDLNCAGNAIAKISFASSTYKKLQAFVCADNQLQAITGVNLMTGLKTLWAQRNKLSALKLSASATGLRNLLASSNGLTELTLPKNMTDFAELWVENNQLEQLELDGTAAEKSLQTLSADHNKINMISWGGAQKAPALKNLYVHENSLFFNSLPKLKDATFNYIVAPQNPHFLIEEFSVGEKYNLRPQLGVDCFGSVIIGISYTTTDLNGKELEKGNGLDYTYSSGNWTFHKEQPGVVITGKASYYPNLVLSTVSAKVIPPVGIGNTLVDEDNQSGTVYDLSGRRVENPTKGIYIINGQKVIMK